MRIYREGDHMVIDFENEVGVVSPTGVSIDDFGVDRALVRNYISLDKEDLEGKKIVEEVEIFRE